MENCPCGSGRAYEECCGPIIDGEKLAETPEQLTRARYTACKVKKFDFMDATCVPPESDDVKSFAENVKDVNLEMWDDFQILSTKDGGPDDVTGEVVFKSGFTVNNQPSCMYERSFFRKVDGKWLYEDGEDLQRMTIYRDQPKVGRNDPCPCGSGKKYKKCCGKNS